MIDTDLQSKIEQSMTLLADARAFVEKADYDDAARCANEVLELLEKHTNRKDIGVESDAASQLHAVIDLVAHAYNRLLTISVMYADFGLAHSQAETGIQYAERIGNTLRVGHILGNIGNIYSAISDYPQALEYFQKAIDIYEEYNHEGAVATTVNNIGLLYLSIGDTTSALDYHLKSLALFEKLGNKDGVALNLGNMGVVYEKLSDYAAELEYSQKALAIYNEIGNKEGIARTLGNIGFAYQDLSEYSLALECQQKALALNEELGLKSQKALNFSNMGILYSTPKYDGYDAGKAEQYLFKAMEINDELGIKYQNIDVFKTLADLYEHQNKWEAVEYFRKYHNLEKEVQSEEAKKQANLMEQRKQAAEREKALAVERADAEATKRLLHRTLPPSIADRVIQGELRIADHFESASVLFADVVGFTQLSAKLPPAAVLAFMNFIFEHFDALAAKHGCERIKTIGDGYMAVCGAPVCYPNHAERLALMALDMMEDIILPEEIREHLPAGTLFHLRIGLHCGEITAGLIGTGKLAYDIYGDAVNTAARMESHGEANKIHVSEEFAFHLQNRMNMTGDNLGGVIFTEREEIEIKGKGKMKTYYLENRSKQ